MTEWSFMKLRSKNNVVVSKTVPLCETLAIAQGLISEIPVNSQSISEGNFAVFYHSLHSDSA